MISVPRPEPDELSRPFWDACRRHELVVLTCRRCGARLHPPRPACPECWSEDVEWERCRGTGVIETFTVLHRAPFPGFPVPWVVALVVLAEGHAMLSGLVECDPAAVTIGAVVEVVFEAAGDGLVVPLFRLHRSRTAAEDRRPEQ